MKFLQIVTSNVINVYLFLLSVSGEDLYFGLMIEDRDDGGVRMGAECARNWINSNLLSPGYSLHYIESRVLQLDLAAFLNYLFVYYIIQIKCNRTIALNELFSSIYNSSHRMVALIEAGCSIATEATAEISHYYNITQV